jgi:hypothetical protein
LEPGFDEFFRAALIAFLTGAAPNDKTFRLQFSSPGRSCIVPAQQIDRFHPHVQRRSRYTRPMLPQNLIDG